MRWTIPRILMAAGTLAGCSGPPRVRASDISALAVEGADHQSAMVGTTLRQPLGIRVLVEGKPVPGVAVSWAPTAGSLSIASGLTDSAGIASAWWTLGPESGEFAAYATVRGLEKAPVQFTATAIPWVEASIEPGSEELSGPVGMPLARKLRVLTRIGGKPAEGIQVGWSATSGSVMPATGRTDAEGIATATWTLGMMPGEMHAMATVERSRGPALTFSATGLPRRSRRREP